VEAPLGGVGDDRCGRVPRMLILRSRLEERVKRMKP